MIYGLNIDTTSPVDFATFTFLILLMGLRITVAAALLGFVVAAVLGLIFAILRRSRNPFITAPLAVFLEFVRDTPLLIQLFFLYYVLPLHGLMLPAFLTGVIALGIQYSAYTAEIYRAGISAIDRGQWEAAVALNLSRRTLYRDVVLPQVVPRVIPALGNCVVSLLKETPILATVSILEMLNLSVMIANRTFNYIVPLSLAGFLMLAVTSLFAYLIRRLEILVPKRGIQLR